MPVSVLSVHPLIRATAAIINNKTAILTILILSSIIIIAKMQYKSFLYSKQISLEKIAIIVKPDSILAGKTLVAEDNTALL